MTGEGKPERPKRGFEMVEEKLNFILEKLDAMGSEE